MLNFPSQTRVYLCTAPVDLRKSFEAAKSACSDTFTGVGESILDQ